MQEGFSNRARRFCMLSGSVMMAMGVTLVVAITMLYAYGAYEQYRFEQTPIQIAAAGTMEDSSVLEVETTTSPDSLLEKPGNPALPPGISPPTISPARRPAATRIRIPSINVDSAVVEAPLKNGEWQVPKFVAGHLEGTANPGESGNVAISGHVESIASGNVFAQLKEVALGDIVTLLGGEEEFRYVVSEIKTVKNDDISVVMPTPEPILTLITCTGTWNPLTRDYSHRLIVVGKPANQGSVR